MTDSLHGFSVGDRVSVTNFSTGQGTVTSFSPGRSCCIQVLRDGASSPIGFQPRELSHVKGKTPQDWADEYSKARKDCEEARERCDMACIELTKLGYTLHGVRGGHEWRKTVTEVLK